MEPMIKETTGSDGSRRENSPIANNSVMRKRLLAVVVIVVGAATISPFFFSRDSRDRESQVPRLINTHDLAAHFGVMTAFDRMLRSGFYYPRWLPDINKGYGNPTMNFYPPGFYYLTSAVNVVVGDWTWSLFTICLLAMIGSGLAFYLLSRLFMGRFASAVGAVFYMAIPYHVLDLYWRAALPEFVGFVLIPLTLFFAFKVGTGDGPHYVAGLAVCYGLHLFIHFPVSYLFTYALALHALLWSLWQRDWRILYRLGLGMALGLSLASIYWLPAALEAKYTQEPISEIFPYKGTMVTLTPGANAFDSLVNYVFVFQTIALIVVASIVILTSRKPTNGSTKPERAAQIQTGIWVILGVVTTLMSTILAAPLAMLIPKIQATVPAWRWFAIADVYIALLVGVATHRMVDGRQRNVIKSWAYRIAVLAVVASNVWLTTQHVIINSLSNGTFKEPAEFLQAGFTPKDSPMPDQLPDGPRATFRPAGGTVEVVRWDPLHREVIATTDQPRLLRFKSYFFPGWVARVNGVEGKLAPDASGIQSVFLDPGQYRIEVFFVSTGPRILGTALAAIAFALICFLIAHRYWKRR